MFYLFCGKCKRMEKWDNKKRSDGFPKMFIVPTELPRENFIDLCNDCKATLENTQKSFYDEAGNKVLEFNKGFLNEEELNK